MQESNNTYRYSAPKLQQLKMWLQDMKEKGHTKFFEVYVDNTKVVPKTENIDDLDDHENYVDEDTEKVLVFIYNTPGSNRYRQNIYVLKEKTPPVIQNQSLSGPEVEAKIDEKVQKAKQEWAFDLTKKELEENKRQLSEAEDYIEKLKGIIAETKEKLQKAESLGDFTSVIKDLAPQFLLPLRKNSSADLSGAAGEKPKAEASFSKASPKPAEKQANILDEKFSEEELLMVMTIVEALSEDKTSIKPVAELLNINTNQQKTKTNGKS